MASNSLEPLISVIELDEVSLICCKICEDRHQQVGQPKVPKVLPCGHTICQQCLEEWFQKTNGRGNANISHCPTCRQSWKMPSGGVSKLPTNFESINLNDLVTQKEEVPCTSRIDCENCAKLQQDCREYQESLRKCENKIEKLQHDWKLHRRGTIETLEDIAERIARHHKNCNIARLAGASVSSAGAITAVVGLVLSPFTFGASLIVSGVGIGVAVAGGSTHGGAAIAEVALSNKNLEEAQDNIDADDELLRRIELLQKEYEEINSEYIKNLKKSYNPKKGLRYVAGVGAHTSTLLVGQAGAIATRFASEGAVVATGLALRIAGGIAAGGFAAVSIGFDIYTFVTVGKDVHNKGKGDGHNELRTMIDRLKEGFENDDENDL